MGRRLVNRQYKLGSRAPSMQTITGDSGIANLSPYLTINGTTVAPTFIYHGNDATASTFPAQWGETLAIAGTGTAPSLNQPALGNGTYDYAVQAEKGEYYISSGNSYADLASDDLVFELTFKTGALDGTYPICGKRSAADTGYLFYTNSGGRLNLLIGDGVGTATIATGVLSANQHYHAMFFVDRSGSGQAYMNSVASGSAAVVSAIGSIDSATPLRIFSDAAGGYVSDNSFSMFAIWQQSAWLDTHLQAAVALERFQKWSGIYPTKASGTAAPTYSRACSAYATKWNGTSYDLINCSAGLPRVDYVLDDSGTPFKGMLIEPQATNLLPYSSDIDNAAWVKTGCTIGASTGVTTPAQSIDYQSIIVDSGTISNPNITESIACTADNYSYSAIVRAGSSGFCFLRQYAGATGGSKVYFNLTTGAVASSSGTQVVDSNIESLGGGDYLISAVFTCTSGANLVQVYPADTDGGSAVVGDGSTVNTYVGFIQAELGNKPTSRIYTAGAAATRLADDLQYNGDNVTAGQGTFKCEFLMDNYDSAASTWIVDINNSSTANTYIDAYCNTSDVSNFRGRISGVTQWWIVGSDVVTDGNKHDIRGIWESNNAKQYIDGAIDGTPDTSGTVPTGLDEIYVGQDDSSANQLNGRIRNVAIYSFASSDV